MLLLYIIAEITGALFGSFCKICYRDTSVSWYQCSKLCLSTTINIYGRNGGSALLMTVILVVVYTKGLRGFGGIAIGGIVGLDIFFLAFISGASMNPARSLAPALLSGVIGNLWLYWTATFVGTSLIAFIFRRHF